VILVHENGEEIMTDILNVGSNFGAYSLILDHDQMFTFKAHTPLVVQTLDRETIND
jgi:hypothetical protein